MWNSCLLQWIIALSSAFVNNASAYIYLTASSTSYGVITINYNDSYVDECWIIDAGPDCIVHAFTNITIGFEMGCDDKLVLRCNGDNGPKIGAFYDGEDIDDVYSSRERMFVRFTRVSPCIGHDLIINYEAISSDSHSASCRHRSNPHDEGHSSLYILCVPFVFVGLVIFCFLVRFGKLRNCCGKQDVTSDVRYFMFNQQNDNNAVGPAAQPPVFGNCDCNINQPAPLGVIQPPSYPKAMSQHKYPPKYHNM